MSLQGAWQQMPHGEIVAMWVDGHLFWLGPDNQMQLDPREPAVSLHPALDSAARLLCLAAEANGRAIVSLRNLLKSHGEWAHARVAPLPASDRSSWLPHEDGLAYYLLASESDNRVLGTLAVLCGWPKEVVSRCQRYLAMHEESVCLTPQTRADILWSARNLARSGLVVFALAFAVIGALVETARAECLSFTLAALVAVQQP